MPQPMMCIGLWEACRPYGTRQMMCPPPNWVWLKTDHKIGHRIAISTIAQIWVIYAGHGDLYCFCICWSSMVIQKSLQYIFPDFANELQISPKMGLQRDGFVRCQLKLLHSPKVLPSEMHGQFLAFQPHQETWAIVTPPNGHVDAERMRKC